MRDPREAELGSYAHADRCAHEAERTTPPSSNLARRSGRILSLNSATAQPLNSSAAAWAHPLDSSTAACWWLTVHGFSNERG